LVYRFSAWRGKVLPYHVHPIEMPAMDTSVSWFDPGVMMPNSAVMGVVRAVETTAFESCRCRRHDALGLAATYRAVRPVGRIALNLLKQIVTLLTPEFI